jgi:hypothetical protein
METILTFLFDKLEYIVGIAGGLGVGLYMMTRKTGSNENDMTQRVIKLKRYGNSISQRTKSLW